MNSCGNKKAVFGRVGGGFTRKVFKTFLLLGKLQRFSAIAFCGELVIFSLKFRTL